MDFAHSAAAADHLERIRAFIHDEVAPVEPDCLRALAADPWTVPPVIEELKRRARERGLWNLFLPAESGLGTLEYAPLAEEMGRSVLAPEVFNCNAPDTGNMELLHLYGSPEQRDRWLRPLLAGEVRSAFCMTEPDVASSDATTMAATAVVDGDEVVLDGTKWLATGTGHANCAFVVFMGLSRPAADRRAQHSMVLVPMDTPGVRVERLLPVFGRYDPPYGHGEITFTDVRLPLDAVIGGVGRGFEIAQGRLGPGRVHHCMRLIGLAELALELACRRATRRTAFGRPLVDLGGNRERIADARIAIDQARLLVLNAAWKLDAHGVEGARSAVSQIKVAVPSMALGVIDMAIQLHGGAGMTDDFPLAAAYASARALRLADGPDEVHRAVVARAELAKYR
ncbi:acyl-CoA dehydrogenase family protein [Actinokineospora auranticolor]|uniref:Acyl-CoA dehydrogenase n=1 Tax=Actinokineospora auranticolor TaxID=155976 RepID=A0A2S6GUW7_9PSEU|nr:acyl-CoA dehydrogenase family protein [Actinokineospora auranticolor]PPK68989.1 acyl-CoA dehydrogenase [Actinokineospora auranticolor]